jgi:nicotinate-nucleotide adenylyltransferase
MTRVALFGGSFNPPHAAHQLVALYVLETQPVDELWIVPTYVHPLEKKLASYEHRTGMCRLMAAPLGPRAIVSTIEEELAQRPGFRASRTLDLVTVLVDERGLEVRLVVGSDILAETAKWYRWDEVVAKAPLIVLGREGAAGEGAAAPTGSVVTGVQMPAISSTRIRGAFASGDPASAANLVPRSVYSYIVQHHLYQEASA